MRVDAEPPIVDDEAVELGEGAGDERGARRGAEAGAVHRAAGDGVDVLERARELDADAVVGGVGAEGGAGEGGGDVGGRPARRRRRG